ncbi:PREDICTED: dopamine receptor 1-like, partial [Rhagoletis zephyria]|uniref:dopamine receptor 1-like n=1 Tax=Rhagoletis zephyria TaxID=28612 RepID=UPI00081194D2
MTFALANDLLDYWPFGPQLCEIWIAFDISCSTCSIINLCAIALDRYVHIKDPMRYNRWMTKKVVIGAVSLIWLVSCGISFVPISLGWHKPDQPTTTNFGYTDDPMFPQCTLDLTPTYAVVSSTISFYLPCIVMLYLYAKLYSICQEHVRCIKSMTKFQAVPISHQSLAPNHNQSYIPSTPQIGTPTRAHSGPLPPTRISVSSNIGSASAGSQSHVTEHKAAITLGIIMGTFLASWVPFFCINIWAAFCKTCVPGLVFKILTWLGYFNSCMNPVIYSIFNTEFRDAFRRILIRYIFNGDTTAACSRLVPCKTPRSSTATVTGSLTVNNQIHNHNLNNNNNNCTKSHFNVMTTIAVSTGSMSQLPKASIDDRSLDSGILNASPHNENENHEAEDVE